MNIGPPPLAPFPLLSASFGSVDPALWPRKVLRRANVGVAHLIFILLGGEKPELGTRNFLRRYSDNVLGIL